jgi:hypothetical protein
MSLQQLFIAFSEYLHSSHFLASARHTSFPNAFSRDRKLPLPALIALLLSGMRKNIQAELDEFFVHLEQQAQLARHVSERAFFSARAKLAATAIPALNTWLVEHADASGFVPRWHGLRLVAADASTLKFGHRASHVPRAASTEQIAFGLFLPGAEMMLAASLHSIHENERQMLFQHLDLLTSGDVLLMDRGYPCRRLVALLNQRSIGFCMRVEKAGNTGFACVRDFLRSGLQEQVVILAAPDKADAIAYECTATPQTVRLVRHVASTGKVRVLMTNLLDPLRFPAAEFGDLYHQRWRIEESFKRLKHRLNLEHVSGLSQLAAMQDFAAKIVCDNMQALVTGAAIEQFPIAPTRRANRGYAHTVLKPLWPSLLLRAAQVIDMLANAMRLITRKTFFHKPGRSKERTKQPKPHKPMTQKPC